MEQIRNRWTGEVIATGKTVKNAVETSDADLMDADLKGADLKGANLMGAYLRDADLKGADLRYANLRGANLRGANLRGANLRDANLRYVNLRDANLMGADLRDADLMDAEILFPQFPSLRLLSSINLGEISDELALEIMRWDANCHPKPELFDTWAKGGDCPYQNEERFFLFCENRNVWKPGKPTMTGAELILAICKEKGWKIKGYLQ